MTNQIRVFRGGIAGLQTLCMGMCAGAMRDRCGRRGRNGILPSRALFKQQAANAV